MTDQPTTDRPRAFSLRMSDIDRCPVRSLVPAHWHGIVGSQCRCPSRDKAVRRVACSAVWNHDERLATLVAPAPLRGLEWVDARRAGGCNFCDREVDRVLSVRGRTLEVRFCPTCLHDVAFFERT